MNDYTRRDFIQTISRATGGAAALALARSAQHASSAELHAATEPTPAHRGRPITFNLCVHPVEFMEDRNLGKLLVDSGIEKVWLAGWFYGQWSYDKGKLLEARRMAEAAGLKTALVNVPLGHPGNSLGEVEKLVPLTIPDHWRYRLNVDGQEVRHCGCLNDASWQDNLTSLREAHRMGFREVFMDDDLRLSVGPGVIGGCFCPECIGRFKAQTGVSDAEMDEVRRQVRGRIRGEALMRWLEFHGRRLTAFINDCNVIAPDLSVGVMVMYMGCEQAGIELEHLRDRLFRVGEGHFDDGSFGKVTGKLTELASAMFHMNYADPRLAYSESTAFPPTALSAENLGRKVAVPLMAGVQNVMFMSGIRLFPKSYWPVLSAHIRRARDLVRQLPDERPTGVLKLWFGPGARSVAGSWPMIDCLGLGMPVEVVPQVTPSGVYLVQAEDVPFLPLNLLADPKGTVVTAAVPRPVGAKCAWIDVGRDWPGRWRAKQALMARMGDAPYISGTTPIAVQWFRRSKKLLVWNVNETGQNLEVVYCQRAQQMRLGSGEVSLIPL